MVHALEVWDQVALGGTFPGMEPTCHCPAASTSSQLPVERWVFLVFRALWCYSQKYLKHPTRSISEWGWMIWTSDQLFYHGEEQPPVRPHRVGDEGGTWL